MASRRQIVIRGLVVVAAVGFAAANFLGSKRRRESAAREPPAAPTPPRRPVRKAVEGLVATDGSALLARVRRTRAKGVLVNAWASWCGPCKKELPALLSVTRKLGPEQIELVLVSMDEPSAEADAVALLRGFGAPLPSYVADGGIGEFKAALNPRWPGMIPATFLYDPTGRLRYFWGGPVYEDEIEPLLRRYLAGEDIDGEANFALSPGRIDR